MTKQGKIERSSPVMTFITIDKRAKAGKGQKTTFGNMTVQGIKPSDERVKINVARSTEALERLAKSLVRPGVSLPRKKDVPRYSADENEAGVYVRHLNNQVSRGQLVDGDFIELK